MPIEIVQSEDGSHTAFSKTFGEHYHATKDGALKESLYKHVLPALQLTEEKNELAILDICFGLGYNTLATLYAFKKYAPHKRLFLYSPEFDKELLDSLFAFEYPKEFEELLPILHHLLKHKSYHDKSISIELFVGDARAYIKKFHNHFDIIYQDAFSPKANPLLWTKEYFHDIKMASKEDVVLTTYSTALATRLALYENGFNIYLLEQKEVRNSTIASPKELQALTKVDMEHKIACNPHIKALSDTQIA